MAAPAIAPATPPSNQPSASAPNAEGFDRQVAEARAEQAPAQPSANTLPAAGTPVPEAHAPLDEAALQKQMFENFAEGVDPEVQERLSTWLPDVLNGSKKTMKKAVKDIGKQEAKDLNALAEAIDLKEKFAKVKDRDGLFGNFIEDLFHKKNRKSLENLKRDYGEFALKASTPQLAPAVSYDSDPTIKATRDAVYDKFVSGLSEAELKRVEDFLPDVLFNKTSAKKAAKKLSDKEEDALRALAKDHGVSDGRVGGFGITYRKDRYLLENLEAAFKRDLAVETTGELPSVVDMLLAEEFGEENGDTAVHIDLKDDKILKEAKAFKKEFSDLDAWLPAVLAGRGEMPADDKGAQKLLVKFAEEFGFDPKKGDDLGERAEKALNYLDKQDAIGKTLHPGKSGKDTAFLLFTDRFMESTLAYGAKNDALDQAQLLDAANVAEMLLGPDDGKDEPQDLDIAGLQAAILHRTDKKLARPQEVMAATGYINSAETLAEQKTRLTEVVLAFHVREEIGTPPMTPLQWAKNYAELHPEMLDDLGNLAFNAPTGNKMQIITQHLGVPGDHKFMINKKHKVKMEVDQAGNLDHFDRDTKKTNPIKKFLDVAVPVIGTVLTFVPGMQLVGMGINAAYSAYKGAEAIKNGDLLGGMLGIATGLVGGRALHIASGALKTVRAIESKDWMGALAGGLGTVGMAGNARGFQTAANGVNTAQSLKEGDFLQAGAGFASIAGDAAAYNNASADTQFAFQGLEHGLNLADGIQEENYAQIGQSTAGLVNTGKNYHDYQAAQSKLSPMVGVSVGPDDGDPPDIQQAVYTNPTIAIAPGDTLSQIAERHGTTVEALMAANPGIADANTIHAGQQLTLPDGVQPVGTEQQLKLAAFADSQGGSPILPGPGDPMAQPGATHPNGGDQHVPGAGDGDIQLSELAEGAGQELATLPDDVRSTVSAALDIAQAAADGLGALAYGVASPENQANLQDEYDRTQQRLTQLGEAIDQLPDLPQNAQKWLDETLSGLKQEAQTLGNHISSGNGVAVGATLTAGALFMVGVVKNATQGVADILRPMGPVDRPGGGGSNSVTSTTKYEPSPKHGEGGWGTKMDLDDETAQNVLDKSILNGRQRYGYHEGKIYEFQFDNAGGWHGYPITGDVDGRPSKVPTKVLKEMRDNGDISNSQYKKLVKGS